MLNTSVTIKNNSTSIVTIRLPEGLALTIPIEGEHEVSLSAEQMRVLKLLAADLKLEIKPTAEKPVVQEHVEKTDAPVAPTRRHSSKK